MSLQPSLYLTGCFMMLQYQKRRQAYKTADRSLFMVDELRCRREVGGCNKAECISPGMKLQQFEGERERKKVGKVLQILM